MSHPFFYMNPTFEVAYIRYEARPVNYDALYNEAFKQIGERTTVKLTTTRGDLSEAFITFNEPIFKKTREMEAIQSRYDALPLHMKHPQDRFNHWMGVFAQQARAYDNFLASALGFEPTEHSDAPPYIPTTPTTKPQPCVDFGFEPTEASE